MKCCPVNMRPARNRENVFAERDGFPSGTLFSVNGHRASLPHPMLDRSGAGLIERPADRGDLSPATAWETFSPYPADGKSAVTRIPGPELVSRDQYSSRFLPPPASDYHYDLFLRPPHLFSAFLSTSSCFFFLEVFFAGHSSI